MKLKLVSSKEMISFLEHNGFKIHYSKGSHFVLIKDGLYRVVVPYRKELAVGTILAILRETGIPKDNYLSFFSR